MSRWALAMVASLAVPGCAALLGADFDEPAKSAGGGTSATGGDNSAGGMAAGGAGGLGGGGDAPICSVPVPNPNPVVWFLVDQSGSMSASFGALTRCHAATMRCGSSTQAAHRPTPAVSSPTRRPAQTSELRVHRLRPSSSVLASLATCTFDESGSQLTG